MERDPQTFAERVAGIVAGEPTTGQEWLGTFLGATGAVDFAALWLAFSIGQAGAALELGGPDVAKEMVERLAEDIDDLEAAQRGQIEVARQMLANAIATVEASS